MIHNCCAGSSRHTRSAPAALSTAAPWSRLLASQRPPPTRYEQLLGSLLVTFVVAQLRAELPRCDSRPRLFHLRQEQGRREVDVVVESGAGRLLAIEIKAASAPTRDDARHLTWLRHQLDDRFIGGVVLHTGPRTFRLETRSSPLPSVRSGARCPVDRQHRLTTLPDRSRRRSRPRRTQQLRRRRVAAASRPATVHSADGFSSPTGNCFDTLHR